MWALTCTSCNEQCLHEQVEGRVGWVAQSLLSAQVCPRSTQQSRSASCLPDMGSWHRGVTLSQQCDHFNEVTIFKTTKARCLQPCGLGQSLACRFATIQWTWTVEHGTSLTVRHACIKRWQCCKCRYRMAPQCPMWRQCCGECPGQKQHQWRSKLPRRSDNWVTCKPCAPCPGLFCSCCQVASGMPPQAFLNSYCSGGCCSGGNTVHSAQHNP